MLRKSFALASVAVSLYTLGCSAGGGNPDGSTINPGSGNNGSSGSSGIIITGGNGGSGSGIIIPPGSGDPGTAGSDGTNGAQQCDGKFKGYLRDFTIADPNGNVQDATNGIAETIAGTAYKVSPDFEVQSHNPAKMYVADPNMVALTLGADQKPVYIGPAGGTISTTGPDNFKTWYNDTPGVNVGAELDLQFDHDPNKPNDPNAYTFGSGSTGATCMGSQKAYCYGFYPIDGMQLGNEGNTHNYHMTFELHLKFRYHAGQTFTFRGDDDVWAFIDNKLAVDLGGVHLQATGTVNLDTLGLTEGSIYPLDFFWAERHVTASNFAIDTSLEVVDCGSPVIK